MELQVFNYADNPVPFYKKDGIIYLNASKMAKPFDKQPAHWLRTSSSADFIEAYCAMRNSIASELVKVVNGNNGGTWMHEDVAIEFARWLSPSFAIWCNDRIKELMVHGFTATESKLEELINNPDLIIGLAQKLKEEREQKELLQAQNELQAAELEMAAPKVDYYDQVMQSKGAIRTTVIAKDLGMSAKRLNMILYARNIQYKVGGTWVLYAKYDNLGYTVSLTHPYNGSDGTIKTRIQTCWTEKGREFIMRAVKTYNEIKKAPATTGAIN